MVRADAIQPLGEEYLVDYAGGKILGRATGAIWGRLFGGSRPIAELGRKLDYLLGKSAGANLDRSLSMLRQLQRIGISDTPAMREYLGEYFQGVLEDATNVVREEGGRQTRESLLMGPFGGVKVITIWEGKKLLTFMILGGR